MVRRRGRGGGGERGGAEGQRERGRSPFVLSPGAVVSQVQRTVWTSWPIGVTGLAFNWLHLVSWNDKTVSKSCQGFTWYSQAEYHVNPWQEIKTGSLLIVL